MIPEPGAPPVIEWHCRKCGRFLFRFCLVFWPGCWFEIKCRCKEVNRWPESAAPPPRPREAHVHSGRPVEAHANKEIR